MVITARLIPTGLVAFPPAATVVIDEHGCIVEAEGVALSRHGLRVSDLVGHPLTEVLPTETHATFLEHHERALGGERRSFDYWSRDRHHAYRIRFAPLPGEGSTGRQVVAILEDVTERLRTVTDLERTRTRLQEAERLGGVGSWELQPGSRRITYSPGLARLFGMDPDEEFLLDAFYEMVLPEDRARVEASVRSCLEEGTGSWEYRLRGRDGVVRTLVAHGEMIEGADGEPTMMIGAVRDVTEERAAEQERAATLALFEQGFDTAPIGMVLTDPQSGRYVRVNEAMCDLLGRTRDELLECTWVELTHPDDLRIDCRRPMLNGRMTSFQAQKRYMRKDGSAVWASLHVTPVRRGDGSVEAFFSQIVDIGAQKEREERFERDIADAAWLARIRGALDQDRLFLDSQPIVDLTSGETVQNELLLRMRGEDGTIYPPAEFLPAAERFGLISEIDRWVVRQAIGRAAEGLPTEFNLSGHSIHNPDVLGELERGLEETGADPSLLVIEVTETAVVDRFEEARRFAERIRDLGCALALDDFGTGFANLSYLKHVPAQYVKIDMEFVQELSHSDTDERLVEGIVAFARAFDQQTVAEGVEDQETLIRLRELGVDLAQGFLFGRPHRIRPGHGGNRVGSAAVPGCVDPVPRVRAAFLALAARDAERLCEMSTPDVMLASNGPTGHLGRGPYRGHAGIREYLHDIDRVWSRFDLRAQTFRLAEGSVIVFGEVHGELEDGPVVDDVIWVWRLRGESVDSVEAFQVPHRMRSVAAPEHPSDRTEG